MTSKMQKIGSPAASDQPENDSVFDFLYHDAQRVGSFLGQFDPSGVAHSRKRANQVSKATSDQSSGNLSVNVGVAKGQIGDQGAISAGSQQSAETTYDPLWANARAFLDYLTQRNLLEDDLYGARIGQFVLFKGALSVIDTGVMKKAYNLPFFRRAVGINDAAAKGKPGVKAAPANDLEFAFEMLGILPHQAQASIASPSASVWASLKDESLAISTADLLLKHGVTIPGEWAIVGILDAQPDIVTDLENPEFGSDAAGAIALLMRVIAPIARRILGRPEDAFGVTPLLIFRQVEATAPNSVVLGGRKG